MIQMDASKTLKTSYIKWIPQLSILRVIACFAIVTLHTVFAANEYFVNELTTTQNITSRIIENNMMWAVPVFLMITGTLHLDKQRPLPIKKLYKKYILRIAAALLVFSLIFRLFDMIMDDETVSVRGLLRGLYELLTSTGWGHLWYLYLLIGLYILMPFYKKIAETCGDQELKYLLLIYILFLSIIPIVESFGIKIGFYISESLIYPMYLFLGHMIHEERFYNSRKIGVAATIISVILISMLTILKYGSDVDIPSIVYGYQSPLVIAQSMGIFMILNNTNFEEQNRRSLKILAAVDVMTFGIYLVHMVFIRLIFRYVHFNPYSFIAPVTLTICIVGIFVISYFVTALLKKIPALGTLL